jgi:hypothetical protein
MIDYDLLILSPNEFENISRDLLQCFLGTYIESFATGRGGGTDFRFSTDDSKKTIIQAKRYKDLTSLLSNLRLEAKKVANLGPSRYILTTSVALTPSNKETILNLFDPFILDTSDIFGKNDLNNLLGQYEDIERKYYKLWLSSTNTLQRILHSKIYNQSAFELEEIHAQVQLYVQNDSFNEALKILRENRYVIISGIPGIGKTTLSRILVMYLLADEFDEFVFLNNSIDDGYHFFIDGRKQIFFFDDFLGKNFFESRNLPKEDNKIVKFIEKVKRSPDKLLIFSTREYILNQAKYAFEAFRINNIEIAKCVLDLSSYTNIIKAQIIYNHLFFAEVPVEHLINLCANKNYWKLISHPNFNPRIIETVVNQKIWLTCEARDFSRILVGYFDNPESVWLYAFENSLDRFSQYALLILLTMGTPVLVDDWEYAVKEFFLVNGYKFASNFDSFVFNKSIRELENTFIRTQKDSYSKIAIEYQNPSIQDFLINYIRGKNDILGALLETAVFSNQFLRIFTTEKTLNESTKRKVFLDPSVVNIAIDRTQSVIGKLRSSQLYRAVSSRTREEFWWRGDNNFIFRFLNNVRKEFGATSAKTEDLIYHEFNTRIDSLSSDSSEQRAYIDLLSNLELNKLTFTEDQIFDNFRDTLTRVDDIIQFGELRGVFPQKFDEVTKESDFVSMIQEVVTRGIEEVEDSELAALKEQIELIEGKFPVSFRKEVGDLTLKELEYEKYLEGLDLTDIRAPSFSDKKESDEEETIRQIFQSLVS